MACLKLSKLTEVPRIITVDNRDELHLSTYSNEPGTEVKVKGCFLDRVVNGPSYLKCLPNGKWNDTIPTCTIRTTTDTVNVNPINELTEEQKIIIGVSVGVAALLIIAMIVLIICFRSKAEKAKNRTLLQVQQDTVEVPRGGNVSGWPYQHSWITTASADPYRASDRHLGRHGNGLPMYGAPDVPRPSTLPKTGNPHFDRDDFGPGYGSPDPGSDYKRRPFRLPKYERDHYDYTANDREHPDYPMDVDNAPPHLSRDYQSGWDASRGERGGDVNQGYIPWQLAVDKFNSNYMSIPRPNHDRIYQ